MLEPGFCTLGMSWCGLEVSHTGLQLHVARYSYRSRLIISFLVRYSIGVCGYKLTGPLSKHLSNTIDSCIKMNHIYIHSYNKQIKLNKYYESQIRDSSEGT